MRPALVRRVLDGLPDTAMPANSGDVSYALKGTGRVPVSDSDRGTIGALAGRLPLFG
ncbi:MAG: hypothetical protein ABSB01_12615 [Streptosporangiaceae bacterium]